MRRPTQQLLRQLHSLVRLSQSCAAAPRAAAGVANRQQRAVIPSRSDVRQTLGTAAAQAAAISLLDHPASELPEAQQPVLQELAVHLGAFDSAPCLPPPPPLVVIISGPSGVGKDAVISQLRARRPDLHFVITATSRLQRPGEADGVDYFFVSREQFEEWIQRGELLEHAVVYGDYKGIPRQQVVDALANNTDVVLRIDVQGAATVRSMMPDAVSIFLTAESEAELVARLVARKTETVDKMVDRIRTARSELARLTEFDYVVANKDGQLDETVAELEAILTAEKDRVKRRLAG